MKVIYLVNFYFHVFDLIREISENIFSEKYFHVFDLIREISENKNLLFNLQRSVLQTSQLN